MPRPACQGPAMLPRPATLYPALLCLLLSASGFGSQTDRQAATQGTKSERRSPVSLSNLSGGDSGNATLTRREHLLRLGVPAWHRGGHRGQGVKVAVLDSGFS